MHRHAPSEEDARRKMHVIADSAVMFDHRGCVHNAVFSDESTRINDDLRHDDGPSLQSGRL
jgi:hypothetical protein